VGRRKWLIRRVSDRPRARRTHGTRALARRVAAAAAALAAVALASCGGGDGAETAVTTATGDTTTATQPTTTTTGTEGASTGGGSDEVKTKAGTATIGQAIQAVLGTSNGQACSREFATQRYLRVAYGGREGCLDAQSPESAATRVHAPTASGNGNTATATVEPEGGLYDGEKLAVTVVREAGGWKVDAIESDVPVGP
jgi:hypothetical protein